jgi:uncharacterized repeat protein (TIGR03943 family)
MNALFNRWLPCLTLAAWSAILLTFHFTGRVNDFLIPMFRHYVFAAGIVLGLMALAFLFFQADASCCSSAECGHSFSRMATGKILTFLVLLLPITAAAFFTPQSFSRSTMENRGVITDAATLGSAPRIVTAPPAMPLPTKDGTTAAQEPASAPASDAAAPNASTPTAGAPSAPAADPAPVDYLQRTPEGYIVAEVLDLLYAAQDNTLRKDFEGKTVVLIGQFMPDKAGGDAARRFKAVRMFMTCCAADARPVATLVETEKMPDLPEMTWVKVTAKSEFPVENGRRISVLKAEKVEKTAPPEETMLY